MSQKISFFGSVMRLARLLKVLYCRLHRDALAEVVRCVCVCVCAGARGAALLKSFRRLLLDVCSCVSCRMHKYGGWIVPCRLFVFSRRKDATRKDEKTKNAMRKDEKTK